jgi:ATP-dependent DNA ligase
MPRIESRSVYHDHVAERGAELFERVCREDCEGIVAKSKHGRYHADGVTTSWFKIKNPDYSHMVGRREVFEQRQTVRRSRGRRTPPVLCPELALKFTTVNGV